ncbi:MAG: thioredoxin family protein [Bacilli bacterium]|jgi:glutaredoxin-like protein|nr:thioredoxin family protein [Bacilli bacterium]NLN80156.1 glutaredoxin [Erysipelotrichia bacterium]
MEKLLNEDLLKQIKEMLEVMKEEVTLHYFYLKGDENSTLTKQLLEEIAPLNDLIKLKTYDFNKDQEDVNKYKIKTAPALFINNNNLGHGVFYGVPAGHEINTLLVSIVDVSNPQAIFEEEVLKQINNVKKETNIKVFVTTACPYCPGAAITALRLAKLNKLVTAEVYEIHSNQKIAEQYNVSGVPKIVINETKELVGNQPVEAFLSEMK